MREFDSDAQAQRNILSAIEAVAGMLGNTRSVCRKCYIHPAILEAYLDRSLARVLSAHPSERLVASSHELTRIETAVLVLLQRGLRRDAQPDSGR